VHPRLSVNSVSTNQQSLAEDIAMWRDLGVGHVGVNLPKIEAVGWEAAKRLITEGGLRVSTIFGPLFAPLDRDPPVGSRPDEEAAMAQTLYFAASIGAGSVYICSGGAASLTWEEAAEEFRALVRPAVALADELGVPLLLEPTNPLRADVSFVFWQRDAMDLARAAGTRVMLDFQSCWYERGLVDLVRANLDLIGLVQISDYVIGTPRTADRAVPGDGDIPLERLVAMVLDSGYQGAFDLEIMGPRIEEEGYASAIRRSVERTSELLDRLGA